MVNKSMKMDADEAVSRRGVFGTEDEKLLEQIQDTQDERFTDIRSIRFGWVKQPTNKGTETEEKLMSTLPNGKFVFPDRSQEITDIIPEDPYLCLVFEPPEGKVAFAKVLFPEYQPKIYIPPSRIPLMVWRDEKSKKIRRKVHKFNSYEDRLMASIKEMESFGFESIKIIFKPD